MKAWWLAARPKTLTGAMIPVLLAGALLVHEGAMRHTGLWVCCLMFACLMQIAANLINDLFDFLKGSDREDRLGPERACAQGWITPRAMRWGIAVTLSLASLVGLCAVGVSYSFLPYRGLEYILLGALCIVFAFLYTTRLSYLGWGDALVLVFFGFVPVCGTYYLQTLSLSLHSVLASLISGIAIDALLMINNYRDRNQDRISGKRTVVVRYGEAFGLYAYLFIGIAVSVLSLILVLILLRDAQAIRLSALSIVLLAVYPALHWQTWKKMGRIRQGRALNAILGETSRNMFLMALCLCLIIVLL